MCVLHVVDRVLRGLPPGQLDVEVDRPVVRALQHEEARGVNADLVEQLVERDEFTPPLGHRSLLASLDEMDELEQRHLDRLGVAAERGERRLQADRVPMGFTCRSNPRSCLLSR